MCVAMRWLLTLFVCAGCGRTEPLRYPIDGSVERAPCTATEVDRYVVPPMDRRPIDVLFVIDSCSMENVSDA